jgi:hypothetical protein
MCWPREDKRRGIEYGVSRLGLTRHTAPCSLRLSGQYGRNNGVAETCAEYILDRPVVAPDDVECMEKRDGDGANVGKRADGRLSPLSLLPLLLAMDRFATLEPVRLHTGAIGGGRPIPARPVFVGRLPVSAHAVLASYLAVPDVPAYARTCRALAALARSDDAWERRYKALGDDAEGVLGALEDRARA